MSDPARPTGALHRVVAKYIALCTRRSGTLLSCAVLVGVFATWAALGLRIDARMESLLPDGTASSRALSELRARASAAAPLFLVVRSFSPRVNRALARSLAAEVAGWPETDGVIQRRDPAYFEKHRLLYLPTAELEELAERAEQILDYEQCARLPGCVNLDERPAFPTEDEIRRKLLSVPELRGLDSLIGSNITRQRDAAAGDRDGALPGELCSEDGIVCVLQVVLRGDALDLEFARTITTRARSAFERVRPASGPRDLVFEISGPYHDAPEAQRLVQRDLAVTGMVSIVLLFLALVPVFRGVRSLLVLAFPLLLSVAITCGGLGLFQVRLNLISAFTLAILSGVGIDFGIHLLSHFGTEFETGARVETAVARMLERLTTSMTMAALTTAAGFLALVVGSFRGFSQMGPICAIGILVAFVTFILVLPPLLIFVHRHSPSRSSVRSWSFVGRLAHLGFKGSLAIAVLGVVMGLAFGAFGASRAAFEYDFRKLQTPNTSNKVPIGEALRGTQRRPVYVLADDGVELERVASELRAEGPGELLHAEGPFLITLGTFVPPEQELRIQAIARLRRAFEQTKRRPGAEKEGELARIGPLLEVQTPITEQELPSWVRYWLGDRDGNLGRLGILFSDLSGSDARQMEVLARKVAEYRERYPSVRFASSVALLGEVVPTLQRDAPRVLAFALFGLCGAILVIQRNVLRLLVIVVPLLLAAALSLGVMGLLGVKVNFYNLVVFPLAIGMGIDGAIYVTEAVLDHGSAAHFSTTARGVAGATLTTLAGFASLLVASNPGLVSLGQVAIISMAFTLLVNLVWQPAFLRVVSLVASKSGHRTKRGAGSRRL